MAMTRVTKYMMTLFIGLLFCAYCGQISIAVMGIVAYKSYLWWKLWPHVEVPEVYRIRSSPFNCKIIIDSFDADVVYSKLNMFFHKSLIQYKVSGRMIGYNNWKPYVDEVHIAERYVLFNTSNHMRQSYSSSPDTPDAIFEITPLSSSRRDSQYTGGEVPFSFANEIVVESMHMGGNLFRFHCDTFDVDIVLSQLK
jgi:hypothetical protein